MSTTYPEVATAESGFMLSPPPLENPFTSNALFQRILACMFFALNFYIIRIRVLSPLICVFVLARQGYLPPDTFKTITPDLTKFADEAISEQIRDWIANAEKQQPYVKTHDVWGKRYDIDRLVTSEGWKELGKWGMRNGVVAEGYEPTHGDYRRIVQHAKNYIFIASSGLYSCPVSMTSGAARLLTIHAAKVPPSHPFHDTLRRLLSREDFWTSSQWMTERIGGSDVQNTETRATYSPLPEKTGEFGKIDEGDYLVSGFKFFSSATDANITFLLAKTESGKLSLFLAPLRKTVIGQDGKEKQITNGVRIHRLKNKMGTKELPTAELELKGMWAHLVGDLDRGVPTIAHLLNISRTHNFMSAISHWRRAIDIAKSFAKARTTIDQPLWTFPMHLRLLADMELKHRGALHLCFFSTALLSFMENAFPKDLPPTYAALPSAGEEAKVVLRVLTATSKAVVCKVALLSMQDCQEAMGGVGYIDEPDEPEFNISRLYRDTAVTTIWEGTTNVLASEVVRHLLNGKNLEIFNSWLNRAIGTVNDVTLRTGLEKSWVTLRQHLSVNKDRISVALGEGRQTMFTLAWVVEGVLLALDAQRDGDELAAEVARRWVLDGEGGVGEFVLQDVILAASGLNARIGRDVDRANWDCKLVWGVDLPKDAATGYRAVAKL